MGGVGLSSPSAPEGPEGPRGLAELGGLELAWREGAWREGPLFWSGGGIGKPQGTVQASGPVRCTVLGALDRSGGRAGRTVGSDHRTDTRGFGQAEPGIPASKRPAQGETRPLAGHWGGGQIAWEGSSPGSGPPPSPVGGHSVEQEAATHRMDQRPPPGSTAGPRDSRPPWPSPPPFRPFCPPS